ncbi:F0F1 ATP synthase subunit C [Lactococcus kimchii]|uniref:F0F1 ATP synthase subunit C n=1 Tax=Lactococcus sp. S-13 TaxID=2507158 RepID=UPI001023DF52|nr:F0F1 ATP synthase subunit C [Lactococcus sp. S-13]RZI48976.1 F0F1 ATP synthase subunit C [Lactococcus sp. S-13]
MTIHALLAVAIGIAAAGAAIGDGLVVSSFIQAIARQPELESKLRTNMFLGIAFAEGTFFIALAMAFLFQ